MHAVLPIFLFLVGLISFVAGGILVGDAIRYHAYETNGKTNWMLLAKAVVLFVICGGAFALLFLLPT